MPLCHKDYLELVIFEKVNIEGALKTKEKLLFY